MGLTGKQLAAAAADALRDKKGIDIVGIDVRGHSSVTDFFVVASARSDTHLQTLGKETEKVLQQKYDRKPWRKEGFGAGSPWVLLDFEDVMVHLFLNEARNYYDIERLYPDAREILRIIEENA